MFNNQGVGVDSTQIQLRKPEDNAMVTLLVFASCLCISKLKVVIQQLFAQWETYTCGLVQYQHIEEVIEENVRDLFYQHRGLFF